MAAPDPRKELAKLEKLSVKELRKQAALKNVPLTQISAALERTELINLILRAGPVKDQYDCNLGVKVHTAESIARAMLEPKQPKEKKKKRRRSSSSSGSSSGKHKKNRKRSRSPKKAIDLERRPAVLKGRNRSPSLELVALPAPPSVVSNSRATARAARRAAGRQLMALPDVTVIDPVTPAAPKETRPDASAIAQAGMAAAAALGFSVLQKGSSSAPVAPALGLRPSINARTTQQQQQLPLPGSGLAAMRICMQYLISSRCHLEGNCPDTHITDPEEEMRIRKLFKKQECNYGANCTRQGCLFRHPAETVDD